MNFLMINSGEDDPFAALYFSDGIHAVYASELGTALSRKKPEVLIHCIVKIIEKCSEIKMKLSEIDAISVTTGPGSFTGIRIGISAAKGLAFGLGKNIIAVDNFELMLNRIESIGSSKYCVLLPAKLPEYYYCLFRGPNEEKRGFAALEELKTHKDSGYIFVGNFNDETVGKHNYFIESLHLRPEIDSMAELTLKKYNEGKLYKIDEAEPVYIKDFIPKK